jgi:NAD(P)-dependent dehydrogenase (short-subunit alcohol dehydrogenase family)
MTAVVTGSASGIGAATAADLRAAGHDVLGLDLRDAEIIVDLADESARAAAVDEVLRRCDGVLDKLVVCAGLGPHVPDPNTVPAVNYYAAVAVLDGLLPALRRGSSPAAVVVSSVASTHVSWDDNPIANGGMRAALAAAGEGEGYLAYAWSKNAVTVAVRQRATTWAAAGVRINTVAPGSVDTPLLRAGLDDPRYGAAMRSFAEAPIRRLGEPAEVASLITYLLGPEAGFIHGAQFVIDGGIDAQMRPTTF